MQTFVANFFETVAFITALTLIALTVTLEFWWRYMRRTGNERFWGFWWELHEKNGQ